MPPDSAVSETRPETPRRTLPWDLAATGLCALYMLLAWWARAPGVRTAHDDAIYLTLARSLRHGGYNELYHIGTPFHAQYPPGYPALLAVWRTVFGHAFGVSVLLGILASALSLALVYRVVAELFSPIEALVILAVLSVNPYLLHQAGIAFAEAPYMLLSLVCVAILARRPTRTRTLVVAGAAAIAAALTRSVGIALIVALAVHWLLERRLKPTLALILASAATVGAWLVWTAVAPHQALGKTYVADIRATPVGRTPITSVLALRVAHNLKTYFESILPYHMPFPTIPGTVVDNAVGAVLVVVGLVAGLWLFWKRWRIAALYVVAFGVLLAAWPWAIGRYVVPLLPLVVSAVLLGLGALAGRVREGWRVPVVIALASVAFLTGASRTAGEIGTASACDRSSFPFPPSYTCMLPSQAPDQVSYFEALQYIRRHVPEHARFLAVMAEPLWYYTGRQALFYPDALSTSTEGFLPFLRSRGVGWILLGNLRAEEPRRMADLLLANCSGLRLAASFPPRTYLFHLPEAGDSADTDGVACRAMQRYRAATKAYRGGRAGHRSEPSSPSSTTGR